MNVIEWCVAHCDSAEMMLIFPRHCNIPLLIKHSCLHKMRGYAHKFLRKSNFNGNSHWNKSFTFPTKWTHHRQLRRSSFFFGVCALSLPANRTYLFYSLSCYCAYVMKLNVHWTHAVGCWWRLNQMLRIDYIESRYFLLLLLPWNGIGIGFDIAVSTQK